MSRLIYVCTRDGSRIQSIARSLPAIDGRLKPDNLPSSPPRILISNGVAACITNASDLIAVRGSSLAAGHLVDAESWERPLSGAPDGSYAIFRSDEDFIEIVSDAVASRTVWYVLTDHLFVASTSQRAIVSLIGSFEFNQAALPWMLVNGTLGPGLSWDKRIRCIAGATSVVLDRKAWQLQTHSKPIEFVPEAASSSEHYDRILAELRHSIGAACVAGPQWAIALSGGMDCRTILCLLRDTQGLRAVTWGLRASLNDVSNDAYIAPLVAQHFGLVHRYHETDLSTEPLTRVFERFVSNGEGRIDHISGYMDGFHLWQQLAQDGVRGLIRGDEAFGRPAVRSPLDVRSNIGVLQWSDVLGLPSLASFDLPAQEWPDWLTRRSGESLETWRDRLYQQYRVPYCLGALNDLKLPYVEVINPLLSNGIISLVRRLPDTLRTDKDLLQQVARRLSPKIGFANRIAIQAGSDILRTPEVVKLLVESLSSANAGPCVPPKLAAYVVNSLAEVPVRQRASFAGRLRHAIVKRAPSWAVPSRTDLYPPPRLDSYRLAFRTFLVSQANRMFAADARLLQ